MEYPASEILWIPVGKSDERSRDIPVNSVNINYREKKRKESSIEDWHSLCIGGPAGAGIFITGAIEIQQDLQAETGESIEEWCNGRLQEFNEGAG